MSQNRSSAVSPPHFARGLLLGLALVAVLLGTASARADSPADRLGGMNPMMNATPRPLGGQAARSIVILKRSVADPGAKAAKHARAYGAQVTSVYRFALKGYAARIPANKLAALRADRDVRFVAPDTEVRATDQTVGTGVHRIKADGKANKGGGVNVAVIDTGIDTRHPDLAANVVGGANCAGGGRRNYDDGHGHGTHVAGIIAALDNGIGVVGVAPAANLWAVRVLNDKGFGWMSDVICGIDFVDSKSPARGGPIAVANMSLGGYGSDDGNCGSTNADAEHQAICRAVAHGVTFVVAAGNNGRDLSTFVPASYDEVITASALGDSDAEPCGLGAQTKYGPDDDFPWWSNYATAAADLSHLIAAPGVSIYSTYKGGAYTTFSGTSMASPHLAGSAALYLASHPGASPASVRDALKALGEPVNASFNGECGGTGSGRGNQPRRVSHSDSAGKHPEVALRDDSL